MSKAKAAVIGKGETLTPVPPSCYSATRWGGCCKGRSPMLEDIMSSGPKDAPHGCVVQLRRMLQSVLGEGFVRLYHYGSRVKGDADPDSDYDVLCVTTRALTRQERDRILDRQLDIQMDREVVFDLHFYSQGEMNTPPISFTPYIQHVRDKGIVV